MEFWDIWRKVLENKRAPIYKGLKVKIIKAGTNLYGSLLQDYKNNGFLYVTNIFDNGNVAISSSPNGGLSINFGEDLLIPIYDENILTVLKNKEKELTRVSKEISDIKYFINEQCKYVSGVVRDCSTCKNNVEFPPPHTCDMCTSLDQEGEYGMWETK